MKLQFHLLDSGTDTEINEILQQGIRVVYWVFAKLSWENGYSSIYRALAQNLSDNTGCENLPDVGGM